MGALNYGKYVPEQKMILVMNGDFEELEELLDDDWIVKDFKPVAESVATSVSVCGDCHYSNSDRFVGNIFAYVLLER